jgi:hypothetical protein
MVKNFSLQDIFLIANSRKIQPLQQQDYLKETQVDFNNSAKIAIFLIRTTSGEILNCAKCSNLASHHCERSGVNQRS